MLVLSRSTSERIKIGKHIMLTVCRIANGQVRIGISTPLELSIVRLPALPPKSMRPDPSTHPKGAPK